jgi:hypothetical protein
VRRSRRRAGSALTPEHQPVRLTAGKYAGRFDRVPRRVTPRRTQSLAVSRRRSSRLPGCSSPVWPVAMERSTLATEAEVEAWLERQKKGLLAAIKDGPVLVS